MATDGVVVPADVLAQYERFTLYNSPYVAHDAGCAIDLYPESGAHSPVAGEVLDTRTVRAPPKPYAVEHDHLVLVDVEAPDPAAGLVARIMHVDPDVAPGDRVKIGDDLGELVRAGFFAPWVGNHLHVGFRPPETNLYRASGSVPISVGVDPDPLDWDGTGTVVENGETYAILDAPAHPNPGQRWVGVAAMTGDGRPVVLDGGLPHYERGGILGGRVIDGPVSLLGERVGTASSRDVTWDDPTVFANGREITGLSLFVARDADFGAKLICPDASFDVGEQVEVRIDEQ